MLTDSSPFVVQIGARRVHVVRVRGGNKKYRALRLDHGNFAWASEGQYCETNPKSVPVMMTTITLSRNVIVDYYSALMQSFPFLMILLSEP
jgi:small subunit ribosomal protein S8e